MTSLQPDPFPPPWASSFGYATPTNYPFTESLRYPFVAVELAAGIEMRFRWVPPGRFLMGSPENETGRDGDEGPQHWVTLTRGFWIGETPCTQAEWEALMRSNPSTFAGKDRSAQRPVDNVTWNDCQAFCQRLAEQFPGLLARLPTEAEWEYACRADPPGTKPTTAFHDGSACTQPEGTDPALNNLGWYFDNSARETHPVRQLQPNRWGLHDMHGNVWEWCADRYGRYQSREGIDPRGPPRGQSRVLRGGSWYFRARFCRCAARSQEAPDVRNGFLGFRLTAAPFPGSGP